MHIALSTDHAGYERLKTLRQYLESLGYHCEYFGPIQFDPDDDYPDFIKPASQAVSSGECERGIIMGGSGQGEAMVANRLPGVRCAVYYAPALAEDGIDIITLSREHNDANMLSIGARFVSDDQVMEVCQRWLETGFSSEDRHIRRIKKIDGHGA
jgi:ribose 5-phosphate isomerase B